MEKLKALWRELQEIENKLSEFVYIRGIGYCERVQSANGDPTADRVIRHVALKERKEAILNEIQWRLERLNKTERFVIREKMKGTKSKDIAEKLNYSIDTVYRITNIAKGKLYKFAMDDTQKRGL